ncbi:hypothetical protein BH20ACT6_BH20ACT6_17870 [soil metagenome]
MSHVQAMRGGRRSATTGNRHRLLCTALDGATAGVAHGLAATTVLD